MSFQGRTCVWPVFSRVYVLSYLAIDTDKTGALLVGCSRRHLESCCVPSELNEELTEPVIEQQDGYSKRNPIDSLERSQSYRVIGLTLEGDAEKKLSIPRS